MNKQDQEKLNDHLQALSSSGMNGAKAGQTISEQLALKPGAKIRILGNAPELGRHKHHYKKGQVVEIMWWIPLNSGKLPQCTNGRKGRRMVNNVVDLPQFEIV